ncbi:MAG TPA: trypsin-like peptidase domain-containing protein [Candidatus Saccharimonadales bacterium]
MTDQTETSRKPKEDELNSVSSRSSKLSNKTFTLTIPTIDVSKVKAPESKRVRYGLFALAFILISVISGVLGGWIVARNNNSLLGVSLSNQKQIVTSDSQLISEIAKSVGPSVVSVNVNITQSTGSNTSGFGLFGSSQPEQMQAAGTGIIISSSGLIVTNRHVVPAGTTSVSVTLSNGTELKNVSVLGRTSPNDSLDIAFLKINDTKGQKLTPAIIGNSAQTQVGNSVVAIGNALGQFQNTVTSGIISGYGRSVTASDGGSGSSTNVFGSQTSASSSENLNDLFQTDAAINAGNSGGPLVNLNGQVIGINTAVAGNAQNIGFAIPINEVKGLINQVLKTGKFKLPYLGVRYVPLTSDVSNEYNLSVQSGAFIAPSNNTAAPSVVQGSPASSAGIEVNDIITKVDGVAVNQGNSLNSLLDQYTPGTNVTLTVIRNNKTMQVNVTLGTDPNS